MSKRTLEILRLEIIKKLEGMKVSDENTHKLVAALISIQQDLRKLEVLGVI